MDWTLTELIMVANGATGAWGPDAAMRKGKTGESRILSDPDTWTIDWFAYGYYSACTHRARFRVIREAQDALRKMRHADPSLIRKTPAWEARIAEDARPYKVLQEVYGVAPNTISKLKKRLREGTLSPLR